jgi:hypothetical protein
MNTWTTLNQNGRPGSSYSTTWTALIHWRTFGRKRLPVPSWLLAAIP